MLEAELKPDLERYPHAWPMTWTLIEVWEPDPPPGDRRPCTGGSGPASRRRPRPRRGRRSGNTPAAGRSRRAKQTPPQATGGARPLSPVTIKLAALLELAAWCRRHLIEAPGENSCPPTIDAPLPPAPDDHSLATDHLADGLGSTAGRSPAAAPRPAWPASGQAPGGHSRPGGRS